MPFPTGMVISLVALPLSLKSWLTSTATMSIRQPISCLQPYGGSSLELHSRLSELCRHYSFFFPFGRVYAIATFLILITALLVQRRNQLAGIAGAVAVWTHYFSALAVAPLLICFFLKDRKRSTASIILFVVLAAPLVPSAYRHMHARPAQYSQSTTLSREVFAVATGPLNAGFPRSSAHLLRRAALSMAAACTAAGSFLAIRQGVTMPVLTILGFIAGFSMLAIVSGKSVSAMPSGYYFGLLAPFVALAISFSVSKKWFATAITSLLLLSVPRHLNIVPGSTYRERVSAIKRSCKDTCVIVVGAGYGRGVPGSVMYESQRLGIPVVILGKGPLPQPKHW
jgi:hypothetical protein